MEEKIVAEYDYYTLDQARELVLNELRHKRLVRDFWLQEQERARRERKVYFMKQKLMLSFLFLLGTFICFLAGEYSFMTLLSPFIGMGMKSKRKLFWFF